MENENASRTKDSRKSGLQCIIKSCKRSYRDSTEDFPVRLFQFPKKEDERREWKFKCKLQRDFNVEKTQICNLHFESKYLGCKRLKPGAVPTLRLTEEPLLNLNMTDKNIPLDSFQDEIVEEISTFQSSRKNPPEEPSNVECINESLNIVEQQIDPANEVEDEEPYDPRYEFCPNCFKKEKNEAYYRNKYWEADKELKKGKEMINMYRQNIKRQNLCLQRERMVRRKYLEQKRDYRDLCRILNKKVLKLNKIISKWHEAARDP